ncbi:MAG TPA: AAC(3) family N-acetyltransferase [Gemmatimonadaceae bacterium]|nr:AAC(3) family N-acetyltransferase [Gemmatimonadaceae bacterium]
MSDSIAHQIGSLASRLGRGPLFVHSDPFRAARLVPRSRDRLGLLDCHVDVLMNAAGDRGLWLPSFNYDFPRTHRFDMANDPCQLGPLPEHFRQHNEEWRTPVPMFSVSGIGANPGITWGEMTDPFGPESIFAQLEARDGVVVYYGGTFHYNTIVHYAERKAGGPVYRYDKVFSGIVVKESGREMPGSLNYHVRPMGSGLDYDWPRLLADAIDAGVCVRLPGHPEVLAASARALTAHWVRAIEADPFSLLDDKTQAWARLAHERTGRRFTIGDFESQPA